MLHHHVEQPTVDRPADTDKPEPLRALPYAELQTFRMYAAIQRPLVLLVHCVSCLPLLISVNHPNRIRLPRNFKPEPLNNCLNHSRPHQLKFAQQPSSIRAILVDRNQATIKQCLQASQLGFNVYCPVHDVSPLFNPRLVEQVSALYIALKTMQPYTDKRSISPDERYPLTNNQ